nr:hypothetical protein DOP62_00175 [Synechococcus elongatus PCC 11801]
MARYLAAFVARCSEENDGLFSSLWWTQIVQDGKEHYFSLVLELLRRLPDQERLPCKYQERHQQ